MGSGATIATISNTAVIAIPHEISRRNFLETAKWGVSQASAPVNNPIAPANFAGLSHAGSPATTLGSTARPTRKPSNRTTCPVAVQNRIGFLRRSSRGSAVGS
jgi:hypothetical protein